MLPFQKAATQESKTYQISEESITIVDSADVEVTTTDTKVRYLFKLHYNYRGYNKYFYSR